MEKITQEIKMGSALKNKPNRYDFRTLEDLTAQVRALATSPNEFGDANPSALSIAAAVTVIPKLCELQAIPDRITASADNTVMFVYNRGKGVQAWLEFENDGEVGGAIMFGRGSEILADDLGTMLQRIATFAREST